MSGRFVSGKIYGRTRAFVRMFKKGDNWKDVPPTEKERHIFSAAYNSGWNFCLAYLRRKKVVAPAIPQQKKKTKK